MGWFERIASLPGLDKLRQPYVIDAIVDPRMSGPSTQFSFVSHPALDAGCDQVGTHMKSLRTLHYGVLDLVSTES